MGPLDFLKAIIYTYLINCSFVKIYEELMALCKRQREKVERSKIMKKVIFEPYVPDTELGALFILVYITTLISEMN